MTENDGLTKFLEYLDLLKDNINSYESMAFATEFMGELPLTEEQETAINLMLEGLQDKWIENFLELLKIGVKWLEHQKGDNDDCICDYRNIQGNI